MILDAYRRWMRKRTTFLLGWMIVCLIPSFTILYIGRPPWIWHQAPIFIAYVFAVIIGAFFICGLVAWKVREQIFRGIQEQIAVASKVHAVAPGSVSQHVVTFHVDAKEARLAERRLYVRQLLRFPLISNVVAPIGAAACAAFTYETSGFSVFLGFWLAVLLATMIFPMIFFTARMRLATAMAKRYPERRIFITDTSIKVLFGEKENELNWHRFRYIWQVKGYLYLGFNTTMAVTIPRSAVSQVAFDLIRKAAGYRFVKFGSE